MIKRTWRTEILLNLRYILAGVLNTIIGLASIWLFTIWGLTPMFANLSGYILGIIVGFFTSKKFVFKSKGHITREGGRFILAFLCSYSCNLVVLYIGYRLLSINVMMAQAIAMLTYIVSMYVLSRFLVFNNRMKNRSIN